MSKHKPFYYRPQRKYMIYTLGSALLGYLAAVLLARELAAEDESARSLLPVAMAYALALVGGEFHRNEGFTRFWPVCLLLLAAIPLPAAWPVSVVLFLIGMAWSVRLEKRSGIKPLPSALYIGVPVVLVCGLMWFMYVYV